MQAAVLTFDGFNELDSFVAAAIINRFAPNAALRSPANDVPLPASVAVTVCLPTVLSVMPFVKTLTPASGPVKAKGVGNVAAPSLEVNVTVPR